MLSELEKDFDSWWQHTGHQFSRPDVVEDVAEFVRLLCRIAYCQGRIDEAIKIETGILQKLHQTG